MGQRALLHSGSLVPGLLSLARPVLTWSNAVVKLIGLADLAPLSDTLTELDTQF